MIEIPFPPRPDLAANVAYIAAAISIIVGLLLAVWGRFWSRPLAGLVGVGIGFLSGDTLAANMSVELDPGIAKASLASIFGVLGFVAAPFFWAMIAGSLCASVVGGFLAADFIASIQDQIPVGGEPADGVTMKLWAEGFQSFVGDLNVKLWEKRAAMMVLIMAPAGLIPLMIGLWKQRFITIVMTSLVGAMLLIGGIALAVVQADPSRWPVAWSSTLIPACVVGALAICGIGMQYGAVAAAARKKKAKEIAKAQAESGSGGKK